MKSLAAIGAVIAVTALTLLRDRGAMAMAFLLPPAMYLVFAAVFAGAGQGDPALRAGLFVAAPDPAIEAALGEIPMTTLARYGDEALMRLELAEGRLDAALVLRGGLGDLDAAPLLVLADPGKPMAGPVLEGRLRETLAAEAPGLLLTRQVTVLERVTGPLTPAQAQRAQMAAGAVAGGDGAPLIGRETVGGDGPDPSASYYAAGIAVMFLLFSATQTASGLIDERRSGLLDRFATLRGGIDVVVLGKAAFLVLQGAAQAALVFAVAALAYGVPLAAHWPAWTAATLAAATAAAGIGILTAALCTTRTQAQTVSTFVVLTLSVLGGSMVPRFLMPDWLRDLGAVSPNAWVIELYQGILTRGADFAASAPLLGALSALGAAATLAAVLLSRRRMRL